MDYYFGFNPDGYRSIKTGVGQKEGKKLFRFLSTLYGCFNQHDLTAFWNEPGLIITQGSSLPMRSNEKLCRWKDILDLGGSSAVDMKRSGAECLNVMATIQIVSIIFLSIHQLRKPISARLHQ